MAGKIKGITVEIGGDTSPLNKALSHVDRQSRNLQSELKGVNKLLKFDPTNTELLTQRQQILAKQIETTKGKLDILRQAQEKVNKAHEANAEWEKEYIPLKKQIDETREKLKNLTLQQDEMSKKLSEGKISTEQYEKFQSELKETTQKSKDLAHQQNELEKQFKDGHINDEQYRDFQRTVSDTEQKLKNLEKQAKNTNSVLGAKTEAVGKKISETGNKVSGVGNKMLPATLAVAGIGAAAINSGNEFEAQMSRVQAISGATGGDFENLNKQALQLGADTAFSAKEAADGMENLGSAGFSTKEIMEAMPGMLDLAASSGEDLASSSDIAASTLRGFGLEAGKAGHVADVLAKNAADTNAAVADTGAAMKYIAPVAQSAGWSFESVTAAIGEMANAGIKGEQAGTTLRGALTRLMKPTDKMAGTMKSIGFSAYDSQGKMKPLSQIVGELSEKTKGLSDKQRDNTIATIIGTEALSGMKVLLKDGSGNLDKMTESLKNSDGAAKSMAETMQGNTKGAMEQMKGSIETAAIKAQQILAPVITKIANMITELANKFSALSPAQQQMIVKIAGTVAAIAPLLIIGGKLTSGVGKLTKGVGKAMKAASSFKKALSAGKGLSAAFSAALTPAGLVVAKVMIVIAIIAILVKVIKHLWDTNKGFRTAVTNIWNGIKNVITTVVNAIVGFFTVTIPNAWKGLQQFFAGVPAWWNNLWTQVGMFFTNCWNGIINFFKVTIPAWINSVIQWFNQLPQRIGYAIGAVLACIVNFGVSAWKWVTVELPKIINGIIKWFAQLPGKIWIFLVDVVTKIGQWGVNMVKKAAVEVPKFINKVTTFFSQLPGKIWMHLLNVVSKVVQWCANLVTTATTEIPKFCKTVTDFIGELPSKMLDIGKNIVHGIWDGIKGAIDWLHDRISDFCGGIVKGFKDKLKIHSPSVVLADVVGKNMALGIGVGFIDNMKSVVTAMTSAIPVHFDTGVKVHTAMAAASGYNQNYSNKLVDSTGNIKNSPPKGNDIVTVNQYFQGKTPTPAEHARQTRNGVKQVLLGLRK